MGSAEELAMEGSQGPAPLRAGVLTVSDSSARGLRPDASGPAVAQTLERIGAQVVWQAVVPDEQAQIEDHLRHGADRLGLDLLVTTGGTGLAPRDVTPEATLAVAERLVPGLAERMRSEGGRVTPLAYLSRGVTAVRGRTLIVNLPGSPKGARESLEAILDLLPHGIGLLRGDPKAGGHRAAAQ